MDIIKNTIHYLAQIEDQAIAAGLGEETGEVLEILRLLEVSEEPDERILDELKRIAVFLIQLSIGDITVNQDTALAFLKIRLDFCSKEHRPADWAETQHNLGVLYSDRVKGEASANQEQALAYYRSALEVWNRETAPMEWAMTQYNLGDLYSDRVKGEASANQEQALAYYRSALEIWTRETSPMDWAMIRHNLGNLYSDRVKGEASANQEQALAYYRSALEIWTRETAPMEWEMTQHNLGVLYSDRVKGEASVNQEQALAYYRSALETRNRETAPMEWAMTQYNLGNLYSDRVKGEASANQEQALAYYRSALEIWTRETAPMDWAKIRHNLGNLYCKRIQGEPSANQEQALVYYRSALEIRNKETVPMDWAMTRHNLGHLYFDRFKGEPSANQEQALAYYRSALEVWTKETAPMDWATTQHSLGHLYSNRVKGELSANQEQALAYYRSALEVWTKETAPMDWATTQHSLGFLYSDRVKGELSANQEQALAYYKSALEIWTKETAPMDCAMIRHNLGYFYSDRFKGEPSANQEQALAFYTSANETINDLLQTSDPLAQEGLWKEFRVFFTNSIPYFLATQHYKKALYWIEVLKSRRMLIELDLSSIPLPKGKAGEKAEDYWNVCRQITAIRARLEYEAKHSSSEPLMPSSPGTKVAHRRTPDSVVRQIEHRVLEQSVKELKKLDQQKEHLFKNLALLAPDYAALIRPEVATFEDLAGLITDKTKAAVSFFVANGVIHTITVYRGKNGQLLTDYRQWTEIDHLLELFNVFYPKARTLEAMEQKKKNDAFLPLLDQLLSELGRLFGALFQWLAGLGVQQVYLCAHQFLENLPIHAAILEIDDKKIHARDILDFSYLPSFSLGVEMSKTPINENLNVHALFYTPPDPKLKLVNAQREFKSLADIYENLIKRREGNEATLSNWAHDLEHRPARIVFVSCHGKTEPDGFYLMLADGHIHHSKLIDSLKVKGAFVIASACETGTSLSLTKADDEYHALDYVFHLMGATECVSSFYSIHDFATSQVTQLMHGNLSKGKKPFEAFNQGVAAYLENKKEITLTVSSKSQSGRDDVLYSEIESIQVPSDHPIFWAYLKFSGLF
ncbi:CHAT domain-containing protein [Desulfobacter latus]|uniref:Tetratricopeptide repeat protein n=1 Tax=Desulfobacter latus TaxID=2292 RepID=A0A850T928_9BACT|nr:CHAT domain-containing protein [Desulfobacter latus]NWH04988.1 tetratricopeptide repeat protein [Desulfobacter latus]